VLVLVRVLVRHSIDLTLPSQHRTIPSSPNLGSILIERGGKGGKREVSDGGMS